MGSWLRIMSKSLSLSGFFPKQKWESAVTRTAVQELVFPDLLKIKGRIVFFLTIVHTLNIYILVICIQILLFFKVCIWNVRLQLCITFSESGLSIKPKFSASPSFILTVATSLLWRLKQRDVVFEMRCLHRISEFTFLQHTDQMSNHSQSAARSHW